MNMREIPESARWQAYEAEKYMWIQDHPGATSEEYEQAMLEIAKRCGV